MEEFGIKVCYLFILWFLSKLLFVNNGDPSLLFHYIECLQLNKGHQLDRKMIEYG